MSETPENYGIGNAYQDIEEGNIDCFNFLMRNVLEAIAAYGKDPEQHDFAWRQPPEECPLDIITEITRDIEQVLREKIDSRGNTASEEKLDYMRKLYLQYYFIRRSIRNIMEEGL